MILDITIEDLIEAYRNVKIDMFYEKGHLTSLKFAEYESRLHENLEHLYMRIRDNDFEYFTSYDFVGGHKFVLKKAEFKDRKIDSNESYLDSTNEDVFIYRSKSSMPELEKKNLELDFRIIGDHSIDFHVLSSLWIQKVGYKLERIVSSNSYGCRLNSNIVSNGQLNVWRDMINIDSKLKPSIGNFRSYIFNYRKWQDNGFEAISYALKDGKKVLAVTADLKKYYHRIDCSFISNEKFLFQYYENPELLHATIELSTILVKAIHAWSSNVYHDEATPIEFKYNGHSGIPMGLGASKVVANLLLTSFDKQIEEELNPLYYGRYVDDLFIVINDNGHIQNSQDFWKYVDKRIDHLIIKDKKSRNIYEGSNNEYIPKGVLFNVTYSKNSLIEFGKGKEKYYFLEGISGETFLQTLKESMDENSSEWRLPPDSDSDIEKFSESVTESSSQVENPANSLSKSDGVSIQRLKFNLYLKRFEVLLDIMPGEKCNNAIEKYFEIATEFTIRPETISVYSKYYADLFGMSIKAKMYNWAFIIIEKINATFDGMKECPFKRFQFDLQNIDINKLGSCLNDSKKYQMELLFEALVSNIEPSKIESISISESLKKIIDKFMRFQFEVYPLSINLFLCDLHNIPFKNIYLYDLEEAVLNYSERINIFNGNVNYLRSLPPFHKFKGLVKGTNFKDFDLHDFPRAFYFYTRTFTLTELSFLCPEWILNETIENDFKVICHFFNIEWFNPIKNKNDKPPIRTIDVKSNNEDLDRVFAFTSLKTEDSSWKANVRQDGEEPDKSRIERILDLSRDILKCKMNIDYVIFPELSIPRNLVFYLSNKFLKSQISIIAGLEYEHLEDIERIQNVDSIKGLVSNQLGYFLCVKTFHGIQHLFIKQEKTIAAVHEESELFNAGGKILSYENEFKFLINHGGFHFAGLICNDLLNIDNRQIFRGLLDALIIVEWNPDIDTYDSLVTATSNDLHTFILQVNNKKYGDTRLRGPYKEPYDRDKVRVRGGELDYFVVATLEVEKLREFQRNHRSPAKPFKPVPTGFEMSDERRKIN